MHQAALAIATIMATASTPRVDPGLPAYAATSLVAGTLTCAGGDTMLTVMRSWGDAFKRRQPAASVGVAADARLSADGFASLLAGDVDCVTYVREPFPAERAAFVQRFGREPLLVPVAGGSFAVKGGTHAIAIFVNAANPLAQIGLEQLDAIYSSAPRRGAAAPIVRWGQLGLTGAWAERPIHAYSMLRGRSTGNPPGIVNFMQQRVLQGASLRDDVREQQDRPGETALDAIVHRVADDPEGIGYSGFAYAQPGVKALAIADGGPAVAGTLESVATRTYPLSRTIYLMFRDPPGEVSPLVREFARFVLSRDGQQRVADDPRGFLPLTAEAARAARTLLP